MKLPCEKFFVAIFPFLYFWQNLWQRLPQLLPLTYVTKKTSHRLKLWFNSSENLNLPAKLSMAVEQRSCIPCNVLCYAASFSLSRAFFSLYFSWKSYKNAFSMIRAFRQAADENIFAAWMVFGRRFLRMTIGGRGRMHFKAGKFIVGYVLCTITLNNTSPDATTTTTQPAKCRTQKPWYILALKLCG